jgi:hypothetical protein
LQGLQRFAGRRAEELASQFSFRNAVAALNQLFVQLGNVFAERTGRQV